MYVPTTEIHHVMEPLLVLLQAGRVPVPAPDLSINFVRTTEQIGGQEDKFQENTQIAK